MMSSIINKTLKLISLFLLVMATAFTEVSAQQVYYVSKHGDNSDGKSWRSAWRELDQINWFVIKAGDTIYLDGGATEMVYRTTLKVNKSGRENAPISIKASEEEGRNGQVVIFGGREQNLPYCGEANYQDSSAQLNEAGIEVLEQSWVTIDGSTWRGIVIHGHNGNGIELERAAHIQLRNVEVYNNGFIRGNGLDIKTDAPGVRLSGDHILIERAIIHDNGQDAMQAQHLNHFRLRESWLYNSRAHPTVTTESWNYCTHTDGLQVYNGGQLFDLTIEDSFIGPGLTNGVILGQTRDVVGNTAVMNNVTLRDTVFSKMAENAILSYPDTTPKGWLIERVTAFCQNTKFHCLSLKGDNHRVLDSIFYGSRLTLPEQWLENSRNCTWQTVGDSLDEVLEPEFNSARGAEPFAQADDYSLTRASACQTKGSNLKSVSELLGVTADFFSSVPVISWEAEFGNFVFPFEVTAGRLSQPIELNDLLLTGRVEYPFTLSEAGDYVVAALVDAPSDASNSFFVSINEEPKDPSSIWDIDVTQGVEERIVSWRGNGDFNSNEFQPKVFRLEAGEHILTVLGREANAHLDKLALIPLERLSTIPD